MPPDRPTQISDDSEAGRALEWIDELEEKKETEGLLTEIDLQGTEEISFSVEKSFTESLSRSLWGEPRGGNEKSKYAQLPAAQKNIVLNVWLMLAHQGISPAKAQQGDQWAFNFDTTPPTYNFKPRKGGELIGQVGSLEWPERRQALEDAHNVLGEFATEEAQQLDLSVPNPYDRSELDVATSPGRSIMDAFQAFERRDLATHSARTAYITGQIKGDALWKEALQEERIGINKWLHELYGADAAANESLDPDDGYGYTGSAKQNIAWVNYLRYDVLNIPDSPEEKETREAQAKKIEELDAALSASLISALQKEFGADVTSSIRSTAHLANFEFTPNEEGSETGRWTQQVIYSFTSLIDRPGAQTTRRRATYNVTSLGTFEEAFTLEADASAMKRLLLEEPVAGEPNNQEFIQGILDAEQNEREYASDPEGERDKFGQAERDSIAEEMEEYFDFLEANTYRKFNPDVNITWGKQGPLGKRERFVRVEWDQADDGISELEQVAMEATIPMKPLSTWKGQWDEMLVAFQDELDAHKRDATGVARARQEVSDRYDADHVRGEINQEAREQREYETATTSLDEGEEFLAADKTRKAQKALTRAFDAIGYLELGEETEELRALMVREKALREAIYGTPIQEFTADDMGEMDFDAPELASTRIGREQAEAEALFERAERFAADLKTALEAALQEVHGDGVGGVINVEVMIDRKTGELVTYITDNQDASRRMIFKWRLSAIPEDYTEDNVNELAIKFAEHDTEGSSRGTQDFIVDTISLHQAAREADKAVLLERAEEMAAELKPALEARMREAYGPSILDHVRIEVVVNSEDMNIQARVYVIDSQDPNNFVWINAPIEALIESSTTIESSTHSIVNAPEINGFIVRTIEQREQAEVARLDEIESARLAAEQAAAARLDEAEAARSAAEQSALESERNATLHADKLSSLREFGSQSIEDPSLNPDQKEAVQASIYMFSITAADYIRGGEEPGQALSDARDAIQNSQQYFKALDPASKAVVIGAIGSYIYISGTSQEGLAPDVEGALETLAGQAEAEIRKQMVERYGEDVFDLFVPHVEVNTEEEPPTLVLTYEDLFNGTTDLRIEGPATGAEPQALAAAALDTSKGQVQYIESIISNRERARTQIQENGADFLQFELDALEGHEGVCKYAKIDIKPEQISIVPSGINSKWLISVDYSFTNLATQSEIYLRQPFEVFSWGTGVAHKKFAKAVAKGIGSEAPEYKEQNKFLRKAIRQGKAAERREELTGSLDLGHKAQEKIWKDVKSFIENPAAINAKYLELLREERAKGSREGELDRSDYTSLYNDALMKMLESRGYEANGIGYPKFVVRVGRQEFQFKCSVNTPRIGADDGLLIDSGPDPRRGDGPKYIDFTMYDRLGSPLSRKTSLRRML